MTDTITVPRGYRCPLCPDHEDTRFYSSKIVGAPICEGCSIEISNLVEEDERPKDMVLDRLEALTGLTFPQYKILAFEDNIEKLNRKLSPENIDREAAEEMRATRRSYPETVHRWQELLEHYRSEIKRLKRSTPPSANRN